MIMYNPKPDILYLNKRISELENRIALLEITLLNSNGENNEKKDSLPRPKKGTKRKSDSK